MKAKSVFGLVLALMLLAALCVPAALAEGETPARIVEIESNQGEAPHILVLDGQGNEVSASAGTALENGWWIATGLSTRAAIALDNGKTVVLDQFSVVEIIAEEGDTGKLTVSLKVGRLFFQVDGASGDGKTVGIATPDIAVEIGEGIGEAAYSDGITTVSMLEGSAVVTIPIAGRDNAFVQTIYAGQTLEYNANQQSAVSRLLTPGSISGFVSAQAAKDAKLAERMTSGLGFAPDAAVDAAADRAEAEAIFDAWLQKASVPSADWSALKGGAEPAEQPKSEATEAPKPAPTEKPVAPTEKPAAHQEYHVTFNVQGHGTAPSGQKASLVEKPADPSAEGWVFGGWYTDAACTSKFDFSKRLEYNVTLFAKWTPIYLTVSFNANGHGSVASAQAVIYGGTAQRPADPSADGFTFGGWYTDAACTSAYTFTEKVTADVVLFAKWTSKAPVAHTVTVNAGVGGKASADKKTALSGELITVTVTPDAGYQIKSVKALDFSTKNNNLQFPMPNENVVVTVEFEAVSSGTYTVTVTNDGNGTASASVSSGKTGTEVALTATAKTGYKFKEWTVISGGVTVSNNKFKIGSASVTVKAVFEKTGNEPVYNVNVLTDGHGDAFASSYSAKTGTKITLTAKPETGYYLKAWKVLMGNVTVLDNAFIMGSKEVWIQAEFDKVTSSSSGSASNNEHSVIVYGSTYGIGTATPSSGTQGTTVTLSAVVYPNYAGYEFKTWEIVSGDASLSGNTLRIGKEDVVVRPVFAKGFVPSYIITVTDDGNGTASANAEKQYDGVTVWLTATPNSGYQFKNWQVVKGGVSLGDATKEKTSFTMGSADVQVKAIFEKKAAEYKVHVSTSGGSGSAGADPASGKPGDTITLGAAANLGSRFKEWRFGTGEVVTTNAYSFKLGNADVWVTAVFVDDPVTSEHKVTVSKEGEGSASANPTKGYSGTEIQLTASAASGYQFKEWQFSSGLTVQEANYKFTLKAADITVKAVFERTDKYKVTVTKNVNSCQATATPAAGMEGTPVQLRAVAADGYEFEKWIVDGTEIPYEVYNFSLGTKDVSAHAVFKKKAYIIHWVNEDGNNLADTTVLYGEVPEYKGSEPQKAADENYTYTFDSWDPTPSEATGDCTYKAKFNATSIPVVTKYTIEWVDGDGKIVTKEFERGEDLVYPGKEPTKSSDDKYHYTFTGKWTPEPPEKVTYSYTYWAEFKAEEHEQNKKDEPATCISKAKTTITIDCSKCGYHKTLVDEYGDTDPSNHVGKHDFIYNKDGDNYTKQEICTACKMPVDEPIPTTEEDYNNHKKDE